jgi:metallo-beta-lactamase family protein
MIRFSSHGAAKQVTGSCHLIETARARVLVDCGLFQGSRELEEDNSEAFGFDTARLDAVLLTHAHLDHCGRLPLLGKRGFNGTVFCTAATRELARLVLLDAAGLQEEDARRAERRAKRGATAVPPPLYGITDALRCMDSFAAPLAYGERHAVAAGIHATFVNAGHILGSASILLEIEDAGDALSVLFSGDIGNPGRPLLDDPSPPPLPPDVVVMETTYGDRDHRPWQASVDELVQAVAGTLKRGGNVIIPSFALERAQEVLYALYSGIRAGALPERMPVFLDSPMAISATEIFLAHRGDLRASFRHELDRDQPLELMGLRMTRESAESMAINLIRGGAVIMAGSGMASGGRVRHHLRHNLGHADNSVVFVGYAATGTLARQIIDGARSVRLFGDEIPVRAQVHTINGFSAHAGQSELLAWLRQCGRPRRVLLVHGDYARGMQAFGALLDKAGYSWQMPGTGEPIRLGSD